MNAESLKKTLISIGMEMVGNHDSGFSDAWKAIPVPKFNSYPINNKRGYAAKQKRDAKKARRK